MTSLVGTGLVREAAGRRIVDRVDVAVAAGELLALVGPNGAGKSTLLRLLAGEVAPTAGSVELDGKPLESLAPRELARRRAVMPQQTVIQFAFTVREIVGMGRYPHDPAGPRSDADAVESALARVGAAHLVSRSFRTLSGGEQALVTLARVLAQETPVLLLDEPTASLDLRHAEDAMRVAREAADAGSAVVVVAHDLNAAAAYAHRVAILDRGRLVADGDPWATLTEERIEQVFGHPVAVVPAPVGPHPLVVPRHAGSAPRPVEDAWAVATR